ncbi:MAG: hypothetical protein KDD58_13160, partial [Bdellovibrionales bacterium]|nr:hypothetical protein [Bdellovibrionales bacterium]
MEKAKRDLLDKVLEVLNKELKSLLETSENYEEDDEDNEEMKASTYLEGAQAKRAQELEDEIKAIKQVNINKSEKVVIGSLVEADVD